MNIEHVYVDREGYVWFATSNGLQQFDGYNFNNYNYNAADSSSISYNFISSISEDTFGNIWIGTLGRGVDILNKKNQTFIHLFNDHPDNNKLTSNIVPRRKEVFAVDDEGYMWLNTDYGLNKINTSDYFTDQYHGGPAGEVKYDNEERVLWIASDILAKFNPKTKRTEYYQIRTNNIPGNIIVNSFQLDNDGLIWLGTNSGLIIFDKAYNRFYSLDQYFIKLGLTVASDLSWSLRTIESIFIDYQGCIWIAVDKSIIRLDKENGLIQKFAHETDNPNSLQDSRVTGIYGNDSGTMWVVYASMGVSRMNVIRQPFQYYKAVPGSTKSLSGNTVRSVFQDRRHNLWIGTYSDGLNRVTSGEDEQVIHYKCDPSNQHTISSDYITSIYVDSRERLWIGTFDRGFCFADNIYESEHLLFRRHQYEQNLEVQDFTEDTAGNIWAGTQWGLFMYDYALNEFYHYGDKENQLQELQQFNIQSVIFEPPNTFWITSWNRGISKLIIRSDTRLSKHVSKDSLIVYEDIKDVNQSKIDNCFITLYKDGDVIWLGSNVNGLVKMMLRSDGADFLKYDRSSGAPGNSVYGIAKDKTGKIWISANHGLGKFDPVKETFHNYYESDGLLSDAFIWNSSFQSPDGKLFFGGVNGLIGFYPDQLTVEETKNRVHISRLIVKNRELQIGDKINGRQILTKSIQYTDHFTLVKEPVFTIEFVAINPLNPEEIIYSYMLDGFDKDWNHTTSKNRNVTYNNLRQGNYTFLVKASNNISQTDQDTTAISISILPPWWRTSYALIAFSVLFFIMLLLLRYLILMRIRLVHQAQYEHLERKKTEELFQFKMRFFTDISHEFGNLLSLILSPLQNITAKVGNDPQLAEQSLMIRKNSERLLRLTEQIMDMRKIDLNKMKVRLSEDDIIAYIKELTLSFREIAIPRSMILEFNTDVDSCKTWFDENKLDQIIFNLLSNAFKFTPDKGEISVSTAVINRPDYLPEQVIGGRPVDEYVEIRIKDNGIGIPSEYRNQIFERFLRIERNDSVTRRGTGIGLALTKELVELQAGRIRFESKENRGTCFIILLPVIKDPGIPGDNIELLPEKLRDRSSGQKVTFIEEHDYAFKSPVAESKTSREIKKPVVLLVDDDQEIRTYIRENLRSSYNFYEAENGLKGFEIAVRFDPDIVISDIVMPVMDGIELCQKIKSDERTGHIPVILLTARSDIENRMGGLETGADAYIGKPFMMKLLDIQINNILINRKVLRNKFSKELILKPSDIDITPLDAILVRKAIAVVEKHIPDGDFSSDQFAREMCMSRSKLHRKLKTLASKSTSEFIQSIRLKRAVDLIKTSQLSIEEVSVSVGFNSPAYFTKCYKKHFGKTPSAFKSEKSV